MPERLIVIDTQSLLDWLVFQDPACRDWGEALGPGRWAWIATAAMKAEFDHVLARGLPGRRPWSAEVVASAWASRARIVESPAPLAPAIHLTCTDPDDQIFIDLAMAHGPCHLVTRDRALLKLARRAAARRDVRVCTPLGWNAARAGADNGQPSASASTTPGR